MSAKPVIIQKADKVFEWVLFLVLLGLVFVVCKNAGFVVWFFRALLK